ncbi:MAG: ABC transporter ATP-binding protein [Actinobacteria bacterium]|nr:ABC transporter ATP-binding protein [Actinomycetota bacterium]
MPEIHVRNIVKEFGDQRALDDVSFDVAEGELFTLLGPSGCGKSTTLMSIAGFQHPEAGRIAVGDDTFFDAVAKIAVPAEQRNLGIVFQSYAVWPHLTVFGNLAFPLKVRKLRRDAIRARVRQVLELVEMLPYEQRYPHQLSGGQQQRVALARALVYSPSVLLLDEPFSNLDAKLRERARAWVKELQGTLGLTTIFVTHDQDEALSMSDRVAVMSAGEVQQIGTPEEIYRRPANRFVAEFVGRVNLIDGLVSGSGGGGVVVDVAGSSHQLTVNDGAGVSGSVTIAVRPEAVTVMRLDDRSVDGMNTWEAEVETVAFLGDHYEYDVKAGPLALTVQSSRRVEGDRIRVHIPPDACAVVE